MRGKLAECLGLEEVLAAHDVVDQVADLPLGARGVAVELILRHVDEDSAGGGDGLFEHLGRHGDHSFGGSVPSQLLARATLYRDRVEAAATTPARGDRGQSGPRARRGAAGRER